MKTKHDYGRWYWRIDDGQVEIWDNLCNRQLANLYCFLKQKSGEAHTEPVEWIVEESKRRGAYHFLENTDNYGCYPFRYHGSWMVYDKIKREIVRLKEYDLRLIPPDVRDEFLVYEMLGLL